MPGYFGKMVDVTRLCCWERCNGQQEFEASEKGHSMLGNWTGIVSILRNIKFLPQSISFSVLWLFHCKSIQNDFWTKSSTTLPLSLKKKWGTISNVIASRLLQTVNVLSSISIISMVLALFDVNFRLE